MVLITMYYHCIKMVNIACISSLFLFFFFHVPFFSSRRNRKQKQNLELRVSQSWWQMQGLWALAACYEISLINCLKIEWIKGHWFSFRRIWGFQMASCVSPHRHPGVEALRAWSGREDPCSVLNHNRCFQSRCLLSKYNEEEETCFKHKEEW